MKTLVAYFSASGITVKAGQRLANFLDADVYEIKPKVPYTQEDLDWTNPNSRSSIEMQDKSSRPQLADTNLDISAYGKIFLGFPIWWYVAPTIINTFLEKYDFSDKEIILFATSGGSRFGQTVKYLKESAPNATFKEGGLLNRASIGDVKRFIEKL